MMNNKGFTLVEIMAVIAILAILIAGAGIAVTSVINRQKQKVQDEKEAIILDAAVAYVQNKKYYVPSCIKTTYDAQGHKIINYKTISPEQVESLNTKLEENAFRGLRYNFSQLNSNTALTSYFNGIIDVDSEKCYKMISVKNLVDEGFVEKGQECYTGTRSTYSTIGVYSKGDEANPTGTLVAVAAKRFCE